MASSSLMASFSCFPTNPCPSARASLASSSSVFIGSGGRALSTPASLGLMARRRSSGGSRSSRGLDCRCLFGLGVPELVVIAGVAALVFGPKKLPEVGRSIGKTFKSFQQAAKEFESELKKEPEEGSQPPPENPKAPIESLTASKNEDEKELEASGTKDST